ncbi:MAG: histidine phosphatase family protein [Rickettsiales bacterium]|jgi:broad specificity phosphatase PhoE|nr:histidine phosphatase family protein [Rickettsiales bacterium]
MKKDLYIFRHGETDYNKIKIFQGQSCDIPLNETDKRQALDLTENMKDIHTDVVVSSPLKRAFETAVALAVSKNIQPRIKVKRSKFWFGRKQTALRIKPGRPGKTLQLDGYGFCLAEWRNKKGGLGTGDKNSE